jgi:predicted HicB family RNase H-like nuclease
LKIRKILVSQPEPQNPKSPYFELARKYNLKIDFKQFIQVEGVSVKDFRQQKINVLDFTAVVFTSIQRNIFVSLKMLHFTCKNISSTEREKYSMGRLNFRILLR